MSCERTECDIVLALYETTKQNMVNITFFNDSELLLDCTKVIFVRKGSRLYFRKGDQVPGAIKLSGPFKSVLQSCANYDITKDMEGHYDLKFDNDSGMYYIDKDEKLCDHIHACVLKGRTVNYHVGERDKGTKRGERMKVSVTKNGKGLVEKKEVVTPTVAYKCDAQVVIVDALMSLLREQVADNEQALQTLSILAQYI